MTETHLDIGGAVTFWTCAEHTDRDRLRAGLEPLGLDHLAPEPRPAGAVLRDALEEVFGGPRVLVRPLAERDGFTVVREDRGKDANHYTTDLVARVTGSDPPSLDFEPPDDRASLVIAAYRKHAGRIPASQLSACLVKAVETFGGTRLRPTGAVYWVPGPKPDDWSEVATAVESASDGRPTAVYVLRHRMDADAIRAVRDAVVAEVSADAARLQSEVTSGDLGSRALEARKKLAVELRAKVNLYEDLLSVGLGGLHQVVDVAEQAAATAALLLSAQGLSPGGAAVATGVGG